MTFLAYEARRSFMKSGAASLFGTGSQAAGVRATLIAAAAIVAIGSVVAARESMLISPVQEAAGGSFTLHYNRIASRSRTNRYGVRIKAAPSEDVAVVLPSAFTENYKIVRIEPSPFSTTHSPHSVTLVFKAPLHGELALSFQFEANSMGWRSQDVLLTAGRTVSAAMTINQLVIP